MSDEAGEQAASHPEGIGAARIAALETEINELRSALAGARDLLVTADVSKWESGVLAALRESEARFRAIADSAPAPIWVTSANGIEFANKALQEFSGLSADQLAGTGWTSLIHPDELATVLARRQEAMAGVELYEFTARARRADGSWRWLHARLNPRFDAQGRPAGFVGMALDVSDAKLAEAQLRESEARFRDMANCVAAPVWLTNRSGLEFVNLAFEEFAGLPSSELTGEVWISMIHPDDLPEVLSRRATAWETGISYVYEARFRRWDGAERWMRVTSSPRMDADNSLLGYVGLAIDITETKQAEATLRADKEALEERVAAALEEREQAEEALRQAQKMEAVGQLTGGIAHDFNNLLTIITGNVDAARRQIAETAPERAKRALDNALVGAERATVLTQRLLAFSRRQPLNPKPVDPNRLLDNLSELLGRTLGETIAVEVRPAADLWWAEVDPNQLENAIVNLALNARDAMPAGGTLTIESANTTLDGSNAAPNGELAAGDYVEIRVSDTGFGMDAQTLARAFEPFFTTKEVGKGTGLGLSMVYGFARQSGGHLSIHSKENIGTTVSLILPRFGGEVHATESTVTALPPRAAQNEQILVCEDDQDVRTYTVETLRELGYRVLEAGDGAAALRILEDASNQIDLLFTDVVLPGGMTGASLAASARMVRPDLRVLFTTGYARDAIVHGGRLDPGVELISKPFSFADLAARVRRILDEVPGATEYTKLS